MERATHEQLDRIEMYLADLHFKMFPELYKEEKQKPKKKAEVKPQPKRRTV